MVEAVVVNGTGGTEVMKCRHCTFIYEIHELVPTTNKPDGHTIMLDKGREMSIVHCWLQVLLLYLEWSREYLPI